MKRKNKISFYLAFALILQIFLTPFQTFGATSYRPITKVERPDFIEVEQNKELTITHTLHGTSEIYEPSLREIALVLDVSGSMDESMGNHKKISVLKEQAKRLVNEYTGDNVRISLIQYSNSGDNPSGFYSMKNMGDVNALIKKIEAMYPSGATNIGDGMRRGYYQLINSENQDANKYMIIMTDGVPQGFTLNKISNGLNNYKLDDGNTGINQATGYGYYTKNTNKKEEIYYRYQGNKDITVLGETTEEKQRDYSAAYAKKIGEMIVESGRITPFFIGFSANKDFGYLNEIAMSTNAEIVEDDRYFYNAKSNDELTNAFNKIKEKMFDEYSFQYIKYEEMIPKGVQVIDGPEGFEFKSQGGGNERKFTVQLNAVMRKNPQTGEYDFVCEPFTITYRFLEKGEYLFNKARLDYKAPFGNDNRQAEVIDMRVIVTESMYPQISIEVKDGSRTVDSSPFVTNNSAPDRQERILDKAEKLQAKEGATAVINIRGNDIISSQYAFINSTDEEKVDWISINIDNGTEITNPSDMLDIEGLKSRYYDVSELPLLENEAIWSDRSEVFKYPNQEIKIRSGFLQPEGNSYDQIKDNLFFGYLGAEGVDHKESAKFWGYIVPDRTGDFYFAIQSDDGNYAHIVVDEQVIVISDYFKPTSPQITFTNKMVHLEKGVAYPIYLEYFNWGGEGEFQIFVKERQWNTANSEMTNYYDKKVLRKAYQSNYRVPSSWFKATSNNAPGENPEVVFEGTEGVPFPKASGKYYIAARAENKGRKTREAVYGPFIVDNTPPQITLKGDENIEVPLNSSFTDPGAVAKDFDYEISDYIDLEVKIEGSVNPNKIGVYTLTYSAADEFGNVTTKTRKVYVTQLSELSSKVMIKGETCAVESIFADLIGTDIEYRATGAVSISGNTIVANNTGKGEVTADIKTLDKEGKEVIIGSYKVMISVLSIDNIENTGNIYPDRATVKVKFTVTDGTDDNISIPEGQNKYVSLIVGLETSDISDIATTVTTKSVIGENAKVQDGAGNKIKVPIGSEGNYEITMFLNLDTNSSLKISEYKSKINTGVDIENVFYTSGGTEINRDSGTATISNIPNIK